MKLSIIIVNYNLSDLLRNCLQSIEKFVKEIEYEVIVIDNASLNTEWKTLIPDFANVIFIENTFNEGFAKANNKAVWQANGEYILLLNPDTELKSDGIKQLLNFADEQKNFGCLGVQMHDVNGRFLPESKRSIPDMMNSFEKLFTNFRKNNSKSYYRNDIDKFEIAEVEVITGAFFLCKKSNYQKAGGLDEKYFMYGEDIDLSYTFLQMGLHNFYYGKMSILHHKGKSTVKDALYLKHFYGAMQIFVNKYYKKKTLQYLLLTIGLQVKYFIEKLKNQIHNKKFG